MPEQNKLSIEFFKDKVRFADLMNGFGNHGKQAILPEDIIEMAGDAYDLIQVMTNTKELKHLKPKMQKEGGKFDMCKAIDTMIQEGRKAGRKAGLEAGRNTMNILIQKLMQDNRQEELLQSTRDPALQMKLLKEYSLEKEV